VFAGKLIRALAGKIPILGVCLGHECMVEEYGGVIEHCGEIVHGKTSNIIHDGKGLYVGTHPRLYLFNNYIIYIYINTFMYANARLTLSWRHMALTGGYDGRQTFPTTCRSSGIIRWRRGTPPCRRTLL
jgi:hypothetical protein